MAIASVIAQAVSRSPSGMSLTRLSPRCVGVGSYAPRQHLPAAGTLHLRHPRARRLSDRPPKTVARRILIEPYLTLLESSSIDFTYYHTQTEQKTHGTPTRLLSVLCILFVFIGLQFNIKRTA